MTTEVAIGLVYEDTLPTATDNDGKIVRVTADVDEVSRDNVITVAITYIAEDTSGNTASAVRTVYVVDTTKPEFGPVEDVTTEVAIGLVYEDILPTATDNDGKLVTITADISEVSRDNVTTVAITYIAEDAEGNTATAVRTVYVVDTTKPVIEDVEDVKIELADVASWNTPSTTAEDNEDGDVTDEIVETYDKEDGSVLVDEAAARAYLGTIGNSVIVTYNVKDNAGNEADAVTAAFKSIATKLPEINVTPETIIVELGDPLNLGEKYYLEYGVTVTDNGIKTITTAIPAIDFNTIGEYPVGYTVIDARNNIATATRTIKVVDTTPPEIAATTPVEIKIGRTLPILFFEDVTITEAGVHTVVTSGSIDVNVVGDYSIKYTITDGAGLTDEAIRIYRVVDNSVPILSVTPSTIIITTGQTFDITEGVTAIDNGISITDKVTSESSVQVGVPGVYYVTYTAIDGGGNTASDIRTVIVYDPTILSLIVNPDRIEIVTGEAIDIDYMDGVVSVGAAELTTEGAVDITKYGENIITYTVTNEYGDSISKIRTYVIRPISDDATLKLLGPVSAAKFTIDTYIYDIELSAGITQVPDATPVVNHEKATYVMTKAGILPGTTTIVVTAEDKISTKTYIINYSVKPATVTHPGGGGGFGGGGAPPLEEELIILDEVAPLGAIEYFDPYIRGYDDGTFNPVRGVTRAELATIFARILKLDLEDTDENIYSDTKESDWYFQYIQATSNINLFGGYSDGSFKPNEAVSRGEIAVVFSRYWDYVGANVDDFETEFKDVEGHWAQEFINKLYNAGVASGFEDNTFRPNEITRREQIVVMVNKILLRPKLNKKKASFPDMHNKHWAYGDIEAATVEYDREVSVVE